MFFFGGVEVCFEIYIILNVWQWFAYISWCVICVAMIFEFDNASHFYSPKLSLGANSSNYHGVRRTHGRWHPFC